MKCLMPLNQRKAIAEAIKGKRYVEWGCGGTTVWLAENAPPLWGYVIEHNLAWVNHVTESMRTGNTWGFEVKPCKPGQNATVAEEKAENADAYIEAGAKRVADVYLIDGVVRAECLRALVATGRPMTVFLHDTQRNWYDDAIAEAIASGFERTDYPEGDDYPGCLLTKLEKK